MYFVILIAFVVGRSTATHIACDSDSWLSALKSLVVFGTDIESLDYADRTCIARAINNSNLAAVQFLLELNASVPEQILQSNSFQSADVDVQQSVVDHLKLSVKILKYVVEL